VTVIVYRENLMHPEALEWVWRSWEMPLYLQKPKWVQLRDGHWMKVDQVEEELVQGEIIPWEAFKMMMSAEKAKYLKLYAQFAAGFFVVAACVIIGAGSLRLVLLPQFEENRFLFIGLVLICAVIGLMTCGGTFAKWRQLSLMSILDPGPNPRTLYPRQAVEDQMPHGRDGFAEPANAVRDMGGVGANMWGLRHAAPERLGE
jgi:hypothetical protein